MRTWALERKFAMPVRPLPPKPSLDHLKYQTRDLRKGLAAQLLEVAQRIREFHPKYRAATDAEIFSADFSVADAQLTIAREYGFRSWTTLKSHIEKSVPGDEATLPLPDRIDDRIEDCITDPAFREAVRLLDAGDAAALRAHLKQHPHLARQRVDFEGRNYFRNPTLLDFIAENPIRNGKLPVNIVEIAEIIIDAGPSNANIDCAALNETLGLVSSGRVPRDCRVQIPLIDLLCDRGADPNSALQTAVVHGEFEAANALVDHGAYLTLPAAAALGRNVDAARLLPSASPDDRHRALALASQFGHLEIVRALLDAGETPDRYNPVGCHSHSTPLHQAALAGHDAVVRLLIERGANLDRKDILWQGTAAGWAEHNGHTELAAWLHAQETKS
jgi:hypothetical protein